MNKELQSLHTVRFSDCDLFGHLNNARYLDYFLNAREDHLRNHYEMDLSTYYQQGVGWVVGSHEINYIKPAKYNEQICIKSSLIKASEQYLLVELQMLDAGQSAIKAVMWTRFIPVDVKTGRRANHSTSFMEFAKSIELENTFADGTIKERIVRLLTERKISLNA
ncbi:acyl-CoA thioesterase [Pedobacter insulae]|uniref:Acyl-CoA thioester hydrolase n=1 Tax=Pedobacter insulae TaxID=414048 RepID=A0A1I2ZAL0_9SPHI|nr:acyl-CoA thioesterase [Pedobacter insulae]SFH34635.1 acyl-CoA thioester hydrolase [Pedobacter insulae]